MVQRLSKVCWFPWFPPPGQHCWLGGLVFGFSEVQSEKKAKAKMELIGFENDILLFCESHVMGWDGHMSLIGAAYRSYRSHVQEALIV